MKTAHIATLILSFTLCVTVYLLTKVYDVRIAEAMQPIVIHESNTTIKIVESSKVKPLRKNLKKVTYQRDSLKAENIRKDGIIGDEVMFPKIICDGKMFPNVKFVQDTPKGIEMTEPFSYLMNKP